MTKWQGDGMRQRRHFHQRHDSAKEHPTFLIGSRSMP